MSNRHPFVLWSVRKRLGLIPLGRCVILRQRAHSGLSLLSIALGLYFSWAIPPAVAIENEVQEIAPELVAQVISAMNSAVLLHADTARSPKEVTVSLLFTQQGRQPPSPVCKETLQYAFARQIPLLASAVPLRMRAETSGVSGAVTILIGDTVKENGQSRDLLDSPAAFWWKSTKDRLARTVSEKSINAGIPGYAPTHVIRGLYNKSTGTLVYGQVLIDWNSYRLQQGVGEKTGHCLLNFMDQIVYLETYDARKRLDDSLNRIHAWASNQIYAKRTSPLGASQAVLEAEILITASIFCAQALPHALTTSAISECALRVSSLMLSNSN